jgi:hypothetical protein
MNIAVAAPAIIQNKIICYNPVGYPPKITKKMLAPRLESLDGKTIYLIDSRFDDSIELLKEVATWFAGHMPSVTVKLVSLAGYYGRDDQELWTEIKANGHAAIIGVGHCSTCAPAVATHAVTMETKFGIPTVALHTATFDKVVRSVTRMAGLPDAAAVFVPQPVMGKSAAELRAYVEGNDPHTGRPVMREIIEALTSNIAGRHPAEVERSTPRFVEAATEAASPPTRSSVACSRRPIGARGNTPSRRSP